MLFRGRINESKLIFVITGEHFDLSKVRLITSTGAVLSAEIYDWFYDVAFPRDAQLVSMSGGTDIAGCCAYTLCVDNITKQQY